MIKVVFTTSCQPHHHFNHTIKQLGSETADHSTVRERENLQGKIVEMCENPCFHRYCGSFLILFIYNQQTFYLLLVEGKRHSIFCKYIYIYTHKYHCAHTPTGVLYQKYDTRSMATVMAKGSRRSKGVTSICTANIFTCVSAQKTEIRDADYCCFEIGCMF